MQNVEYSTFIAPKEFLYEQRKKVFKGVLCGPLALVQMLVIAIYAVWHNEIATVMSMEFVRDRNDEHLDGAVYTMHVRGGFYLDKFVEQDGGSNNNELIGFITDNITKDLIDMGFDNPEIGCAGFTAETRSDDRVFGRRFWDNDGGNGCTVHSVVYNLTDKSVFWVSNENFDDESAVFEFKLGE